MDLYKRSPLVSVILPTYNRQKFIEEAIQSLLDQTYENFEVIIVDDGSEDKTEEVVRSFDDKRIIYIYQDNKGRSSARNLALSHAKGDYITFLDSDDLYYKEKIEKQVYFLEKNKNFSMVYTSADCMDVHGNILKNHYRANVSGWIYRKIAYFVHTTITLPTVMVRKDVFATLGGFDEDMHRFEDTDMWRRISKTYKIAGIKDITCLLRTHTENHLENQSPKDIILSLRYYISKIISEDHEFYAFHRKGFNDLLAYYIKAFSGNIKFMVFVEELEMMRDQIKEELDILPVSKKFINEIKKKIKNIVQKKKKILFVAFPDSIHSVRWINQVSRNDYEIYLAAPYATEPHEEFDKLEVFYPYRSYFFTDTKRFIKSFFSSIAPQYGLEEVKNKNVKLRFAYNFPMSQARVQEKFSELRRFGNTTSLVMKSFGPHTLKKIIRKVKPDLIHSLEFQTCSYNVLFTKKLYKNRKFPLWFATNWGSDVYFYKDDPDHLQIIKELLLNIDYYSCECQRDVEIVKELGYTGNVLPVMPNTGGIDTKFAKTLRAKIKPSSRKLIMIKGYQNFAGRALIALDAIEECAPLLQGYQVLLYSVWTSDVRDRVIKIKQKLNISIDVLPHTQDYFKILELFSQARIYLSVSRSDGISTSLLEAMAMGAFPIQTNTSCCNEWIEDGVSGSIISPDNFDGIVAALKVALKDDVLVDQASALNWDTIQEKADKEKCAQKINNFYKDIFNYSSAEKQSRSADYDYQVGVELTHFPHFIDTAWLTAGCDGGAWLQDKAAKIFINMSGIDGKDYELCLKLSPLINEQHPLQRVRVLLNNHELGVLFLTAEKNQEILQIPDGLITKKQLYTFTFEPLDAVSPKEIGAWETPTPLSVFFRSFQVREAKAGKITSSDEVIFKKCSGV